LEFEIMAWALTLRTTIEYLIDFGEQTLRDRVRVAVPV
jgi:hypothetical protein